MPRRLLLHKAFTLATVGPARLMLVAEACVSMALARVSLAVFPFRRVSRTFGAFLPPTDERVVAIGQGATAAEVLLAKQIGWAVKASAPFMPFRSVCLQQAMAARAMLCRRGIPTRMHFSAGPGEAKPLDAHAWLDAAGVGVTGYPVAPHLAEIGCFI